MVMAAMAADGKMGKWENGKMEVDTRDKYAHLALEDVNI